MKMMLLNEFRPRLLPAMLGACALLSATALTLGAENWPQFRGPGATGYSPTPAPVTWNVDTGENLLWRTPVPGLGHASPVIWGDRIFVATAVKPGAKPELKVGLYGEISSYTEKEPHQWRLLCLSRATGQILWDRLAREGVPSAPRHTKATQCNSTPATDGERVVAFFGSEGLNAFDLAGNPLWHKEFGSLDAGYYAVPDTHWGFATSPVLHQGRVVVQCDVGKQQFLAVLDAKDGHELWRTPRTDVPTWSTPLVAGEGAHAQIIISGGKQTGGYDFATGKELWHLKGGGDIPVASPIQSGEFAILTSAHGANRPFRAIRFATASGDISPAEIGGTNQAIAWCQPRKGNYWETPLAVGDQVWGSIDGLATCFDRASGRINYSERLGKSGQSFSASPIAAKDRLYFTDEHGFVYVVPAAPQFSVVATNQLGGLSLATPAAADGVLYFRTTEALLAIGKKP